MILVTGGAGLVGNELIKQLLAQGKKVKAIYNKTALAFSESENLTSAKCDILDVCTLGEVMQGVTEVYHCAAIVSFAPKDAKKLYKINVEGTANIVNACLVAGVNKLVYVSSVASLGRIRPGQMVNETMQWTEETSNSKYGHSKYLAEMEVWRGIAEGLNAVIVNPVIILGAGNWNEGSSKLFKSVYEGFPWYSTGTSGFVGVVDVAAAMIQLMQSKITAERFILSAENTSYQYILNCIAKGFNKKLPSKKVTPLLAAFTWRLEAIKSFFTKSNPLITKETAATSLAHVQFDNSKLLNFLPTFKYNNLNNIIIESCKIFQQKINNDSANFVK
ncbi:MAG: NAD-dependent epimerase/dehydratase family protein [Ferruginibacter sp.]|nr:NAD-dependent epimerase/dehydratase family protein [Ferruginibacter sp.]